MSRYVVLMLAATGCMLLLLGYYPHPQADDSNSNGPSERTGEDPSALQDGQNDYQEQNLNGSPLGIGQPGDLLQPQFLSEPNFEFFEDHALLYAGDDGSLQRYVGETKMHAGETFFAALRSLQVEPGKILAMAEVCRESYSLDKLATGTVIRLYQEKRENDPIERLLVKVEVSALETLEIRELQEGFEVELVEAEKNIVQRVFSGRIEGHSLWTSVLNSGLSGGVARELNQILGSYLGSGSQVQKGDRWQIMVEELWVEQKVVSFGNIVAASYQSQQKPNPVSLYRYEEDGTPPGFYYEDGTSTERAFHQSPIPGARITSGFSTRFHPILKVSRPHLGIDYGAPIGTPVKSVGDGRVVQMTQHQSFGKMIKVRHGQGYETMYAHLRGFAAGLRVGHHVKKGELIGFVGMTGRTTGPHLHFAMLQNRQFVNPRKIVVPRKDNLSGAALDQFLAHVGKIKEQMQNISL